MNTSDSYRFGYNGKEKLNEQYGEGNCYDYGFRIYDPRISRFLSVDPLFRSYPWYTPYQFASNQPISCIDLDGLESYLVTIDINRETGESSTRIELTDLNAPLSVTYKINDGVHQYTYTAGGFGDCDQEDRANQILESYSNPNEVEGGTTRLVALTYTTQFDLNNNSVPNDLSSDQVANNGGFTGKNGIGNKSNKLNGNGGNQATPVTIDHRIKIEDLRTDFDGIQFQNFTNKVYGIKGGIVEDFNLIGAYYKENKESFAVTITIGYNAPGFKLDDLVHPNDPNSTQTYGDLVESRKLVIENALQLVGIPKEKISWDTNVPDNTTGVKFKYDE